MLQQERSIQNKRWCVEAKQLDGLGCSILVTWLARVCDVSDRSKKIQALLWFR